MKTLLMTFITAFVILFLTGSWAWFWFTCFIFALFEKK